MFFHFILGYKHETLSRVLRRKKSNLSQTPIFYSQMYILPTRRQLPEGRKIFLRFQIPIAHWKGHVLQTKRYRNIIPLFFVFQKLLRFIYCQRK